MPRSSYKSSTNQLAINNIIGICYMFGILFRIVCILFLAINAFLFFLGQWQKMDFENVCWRHGGSGNTSKNLTESFRILSSCIENSCSMLFLKKLEALPFEWLFEGVLCHITKHPPFQWFFSTQNPSIFGERLGGGRTPNDASCVRRVGSCAKACWLGAVQYFMYLGT